jgi:hypothetical protein
MSSGINFPPKYKMYEKLEICSNSLINVKAPFVIHSNPVLLIGNGDMPIIWISAPVQPNSSKRIYVVEENSTNNPAIYIEKDEKNKKVLIQVGNTTILEVTAKSETDALVTKLDFRPIGLNVHGDKSGLNVGTMFLSGNSLANSEIAFNLG